MSHVIFNLIVGAALVFLFAHPGIDDAGRVDNSPIASPSEQSTTPAPAAEASPSPADVAAEAAPSPQVVSEGAPEQVETIEKPRIAEQFPPAPPPLNEFGPPAPEPIGEGSPPPMAPLLDFAERTPKQPLGLPQSETAPTATQHTVDRPSPIPPAIAARLPAEYMPTAERQARLDAMIADLETFIVETPRL